LSEALAALRPYRFGSPDETVPALLERIQKEIGLQRESGEVEDIEDADVSPQGVDNVGLAGLLHDGLEVLAEAGDSKWELIRERILDPAVDEKVVLFAQPIETVTALAAYLERQYGRKAAVIIGGQSDQTRQEEIDKFLSPAGARFLVSSRAGGEGINLQVARRLVHVDVPWNPMDMEQRVGRVHRFGSRETILVDTLVMRNSREEEAYAAADRKLRLIASTLVERDRADSLFSRVMCLIPPEELQAILLRDAPGDAPVDSDSIAALVQQGFNKWKAFFDKYSAEQKKIRALDPGLAAWEDVGRFLQEYSTAQPMSGYFVQRFARDGTDVRLARADAPVLTFDGVKGFACGDYAGAPVFGPGNAKAEQLGLNVAPVTEALRRAAFPAEAVGPAHLRWPVDVDAPLALTYPCGVLVLLRQALRMERNVWTEGPMTLHCYLATLDRIIEVEGTERGAFLRGLFKATVRTKPGDAEGLVSRLVDEETRLMADLRRITREEFDEGLRYAVTPLFAGIVGAPVRSE
jgi:hypothetical protein